MISLLARIFIKDSKNYTSPAVRKAYGVLCGGVGIFLNILLCTMKIGIGVLSGSVAITADGLNNLSDAFSSVITIVSFKMSGQKPDIEHPFGHGRIEYISGFIISLIILLMGFELLKSSISKILNPTDTTISLAMMVVLVISLLVKLYMAYYNTSYGKKIDSVAMKATATDSLSDGIATTVVALCMIFTYFTKINIDGYAGIVVTIFILIAGFKTAKETISPLLGQPPEREFVEQIQNIVMSYEKVLGMHDLIVHDYGPGRLIISLHAEVSSDEDMLEIHDVIDNIEKHLNHELGCSAVIHMDPIVTNDERLFWLRDRISTELKTYDEKLSIHDFRMVPGATHTNLIFDVVVPFDAKVTDDDVTKKVDEIVKSIDETYFAVIEIDKSYV
ncbi:MAG: cation transporter [Oscillospiraceae bacterium]|nr:cation transporter [Oscillospiraceae bacterium]